MIEIDICMRRGDFELGLKLQSSTSALALFGPSGSGKTTLLMAMAGLLQADRGRIVLSGRTLYDSSAAIDLPPGQRALGVVFQESRLFPHLSVRENLAYGQRHRCGGVDLMNFDATVELLGLGALLARQPASLSGGEARRVAMGRALLARPAALLLDEPLTGLHRQARLDVLESLRAIKHAVHVPMLLVSHQPDEVMALADSVAMIDDGRLVAQLSPDAFRTRHLTCDALQLSSVETSGDSRL